MSRRCHHGSPRHPRPAFRERRRGLTTEERPANTAEPDLDTPTPGDPELVAASEPLETPEPPAASEPETAIEVRIEAPEPPAMAEPADPAEQIQPAGALASVEPAEPVQPVRPARPTAAPRATSMRPAEQHAAPGVVPTAAMAVAMPTAQAPRPLAPRPMGEMDLGEHGATAPQLRRFIKSRAYVPMHELRRRFGIASEDDDVTPVDLDRQRIYVGLPTREGQLLAELLRGGDIGFELSMDPIAPIVVGVYPMRPVPRS